jgi:hypothetical protein
MDIVTLLREAESAGLQVRADGDRLVVRGPRSLEPLAKRLLERKADLLPLVTRRKEIEDGPNVVADDVVRSPGGGDGAQPARPLGLEVTWRVEIMRPQVPRRGPIPFLVARQDVAPRPGCCLSCGDPVPEGRRYRCGPCQRAVEIVLDEIREGL